MKKLILATLAVFAFGAAPASAGHDSKDIYTADANHIAVSGYDTVAYFTESKPVKGSKEYATKWKGAHWHFSSADNLAKFKAAPEKYAPQYGGYCAWAVGHNVLAKGDPLQWHIEDGKLYLNISADIKRQWLPRRAELIGKADSNFPGLIK